MVNQLAECVCVRRAGTEVGTEVAGKVIARVCTSTRRYRGIVFVQYSRDLIVRKRGGCKRGGGAYKGINGWGWG